MAMAYAGVGDLGTLTCPAGYAVDWSLDPTNPANPMNPSYVRADAGYQQGMMESSCKDSQGKSYSQYLLTTPEGLKRTAEGRSAEQALETKSMLLWAAAGGVALLAPGAAKLLAAPLVFLAMQSMGRGH